MLTTGWPCHYCLYCKAAKPLHASLFYVFWQDMGRIVRHCMVFLLDRHVLSSNPTAACLSSNAQHHGISTPVQKGQFTQLNFSKFHVLCRRKKELLVYYHNGLVEPLALGKISCSVCSSPPCSIQVLRLLTLLCRITGLMLPNSETINWNIITQ